MKAFAGLLALAALLTSAGRAQAAEEEPLHELIDRRVLAGAGDHAVAPLAGDAEFLRRVYLDLVGRIPTATEVRSFLADDDDGKRTKLVDRLLASPEFPRSTADRLHVMLMERLADNDDWRRFLRTSLEANVPWDAMARAMLHADRGDEDARGAAFFITSRLLKEGAMADTDVAGLTRDVGRLLAGRDLRCAECHDHISIADYTQRDFQGLHSVFLNVRADGGVKYPAVVEGVMSEPREFMSVFVQRPETTGPRVPGLGEVAIETFEKGEEYAVAPDKKAKVAGVPRFSPLAKLAEGLTRPENEVFRENAANRFWFLMTGRGLVHPLDEHHGDNPASHPELLSELGARFAARKFDVRWLLREIALSETYQRSSRLPAGVTPPPRDRFTVAIQKRVSAEQLLRSTLIATGELAYHEPPGDANDEEQAAAVKRLDELRTLFVKSYANAAREPEVEFEASVKGALFARNAPVLLRLFERRTGNLVDRLAGLSDEEAVDEAFVAVLGRPPTAEDRADVQAFLAGADDRDEALGTIAWALWSSNEFFINH